MRQGGNNAKSSTFRTALTELRSDSISESTLKLLLTRCKQGLSTNKIAGFNNAIRLYGTRAAVGKYNTTQLRNLLQLVVAIKSVNTSIGIRKATPNQCDTIENLALCISAKVMLIQNIWIKLGLVNGTTSTVKDVVQKGHADIKKDQPQSLLIAVDGYNGPALFTRQDSKKVVPIFSVLREWEGIRGSCLQRQFLITLAFALTVYKSQGLILNQVVLDVKKKDKTARLTYIVILQVKKLLGLMFKCGFNIERFQLSTSKTKEARQEDFIQRQQ